MEPIDADATPIRVVIADDEPVVVEYLRLALTYDAGEVEVVATASNAGGAVEAVRRHQPDVLLLDLHMPGGGIEVAQLASSLSPATKVLVFTGDAHGEALLALLPSGISGYLTKPDTSVEVIDAVRSVATGRMRFVPGIAAKAINELTKRLYAERIDEVRTERTRQRIERTIRARRFTIVTQPVFDLRSGEPVGMETLTRFDGVPDRPPDVWFAEAEVVNRRIDLEVATARAAMDLLEHVAEHLWLSINLSPATLLSGPIGPLFDGVDLTRVVIELTEHAAVDDYGFLNAALDRWRNRGMRVAIDDAGSGYASFAHVLKASPDFIKLDGDLTTDIDTDPRKQALSTAVSQFADRVGASLIAEGIETQAQLDALRRAGAGFGQGYLFGHPVALERQPARYLRTGVVPSSSGHAE